MEYQTRSRDTQWMNWLGGIALGALAMYVADPSEGRRRRALLQDKVTHYSKQTQRMVGGTLRDARNRLSGLQAEALRRVSPRDAKPIDNHVLEARVRSRIARAFPQAGEVEVSASEGVVTLGGQVDADIEEQLLGLVGDIPGVESVSHRMRTHAHQEGDWTSSLFEGRSPWWIAGAVGAGLLAWYGLSRRQPLGLMAAATGMSLLTRGARPERAGAMSGEQLQGVEAERSVDVNASPDVVYDVWSRCENFPHFMSHAIEVSDLGQQRSHWVVQGASGSEVEFDARLTESDRPHRLAWRSETGAAVDNQAVVSLQPHAGGTRVTVRLSWKPPAGMVGKGLVVLTGSDPESALDDDLQRMKQFIERGLPSRESPGGPAVLH